MVVLAIKGILTCYSDPMVRHLSLNVGNMSNILLSGLKLYPFAWSSVNLCNIHLAEIFTDLNICL